MLLCRRCLDGKPIVPDGKHIKIVDGPEGLQSLVIDKATPDDAGVYSVVVSNPQGEVVSQAPLSVSGNSPATDTLPLLFPGQYSIVIEHFF